MRIQRNTILALAAFFVGFALQVHAEPIGIFDDHVDLGNPEPAGDASYNAETGEYLIACGGISGPTANYHWAYSEIHGDFSLQARVRPEGAVGSDLSKGAAGFIVLGSLEPARTSFAPYFGQNGRVGSYYRNTPSGPVEFFSPGLSFPLENGLLMKVVREGNVMSMSYLDEAAGDWIPFFSQTIELMDSVYVGLTATSAETGVTLTGHFTDVELKRPIGIFEDHKDDGNLDPPGEASFDPSTGEYQVRCGYDPETIDGGHVMVSVVDGDFSLTTRVRVEDLGGAPWGIAGIAVYDDFSRNVEGHLQPYCTAYVHPNGQFGVWGTENRTGPYSKSLQSTIPLPIEDGLLIRMVREGSTVITYYFDPATADWILFHTGNFEFTGPVYVGIGATSNQVGSAILGRFSDVELTTSRVGIFEDQMDVGATTSGEVSYDSETGEYEITANGGGHGHIAYTEIDGEVSLSAKFTVDASTSKEGWGAYLYVFNDLSEGDSTAFYTAWILDSGEAVAHWRDITDGPRYYSDHVSPDVQDGRLKIVRSGDSFSAYYFDINEQQWVMFDNRTIAFPDPVYVGIGAWGWKQATESTVARFTEVELTTSKIGIFDGHVDTGTPDPPGDATYNSETGEYQVIGGGVGSSDDMHSIYKAVSGDFSLQARVRAENLSGNITKGAAALFVRDTLERNPPFFWMGYTVDGRVYSVRIRSANSGYTGQTGLSLPSDNGVLEKIVREGNTVSVYYMDEASGEWVLFQSDTIELTDPVFVGFFATSWATGVTTVGYFTDVELTYDPGKIPTPGPTYTPIPTPTLPTGPPVEQLPVEAGPEVVGITPLTGDVSLWAWNGGGSRYWRPEADTLSNCNAIVMGGMRTEPGYSGSSSTESQRDTRDTIAIFSPTGELVVPARSAFFTDADAPWENTVCTHRNEDKFYGLCADTVGDRNGPRYVVHTIANPDAFPEAFPGYPPENDREYHTVIQVVSNDGEPETKLINPWGNHVSEPGLIRGGMVRFLSNGNIVVNFEDRTSDGPEKETFFGRTGNLRVVGAVILGPDGSIVKPPFAISNPSDRYSSNNRFGLTSGDGWFVVRYDDGIDGPTIVAFDNDGNELGGGSGRVYPAIDIPELNGDGGRDRGDPNGLEAVGDLLFITHRGEDFAGYLTQFRVSDSGVTVEKTIRFTDHPDSTFDHNADLGVDSSGNVIVIWQDQSWDRFQPDRWEALARMFDVNLEPLTPSFCLFEVGSNTNIDVIDPILGPGRTKQCRIAMNDEIIIAIAETNEVPYADMDSVTWSGGEEWYTYTFIARMLENPFGEGTAVTDWELR